MAVLHEALHKLLREVLHKSNAHLQVGPMALFEEEPGEFDEFSFVFHITEF